MGIVKGGFEGKGLAGSCLGADLKSVYGQNGISLWNEWARWETESSDVKPYWLTMPVSRRTSPVAFGGAFR
jgi:hypothetical protein